jgi:hypothetical protein
MLRGLAISLMRTDPDKARELAQEADKPFYATSAAWLAEVRRWHAVGVAGGAECDRAEQVARMIHEPAKQARALGWLAWSLTDIDYHRAEQLAGEAVEAARALADAGQRSDVLNRLSQDLAGIGDWPERLAVEAVDAARAITKPFVRARALAELATELAVAGNWDRAEYAACAIDIPSHRANALARLVDRLAEAGDWDRAERAASAITVPQGKADKLLDLVRNLAEAGNWDRARSVADVSSSLLAQGKDPTAVATVLAEAYRNGPPADKEFWRTQATRFIAPLLTWQDFSKALPALNILAPEAVLVLEGSDPST